MFRHGKRILWQVSRKPGSTQALASSTSVPSPAAAAAAYTYRRRQPQSVAEVLDTCRLPDHFIGALSARFGLTDPDGTPLSTDLRKGGGVHAFLGRLTSEAAPVLGLTELIYWGWTGTEEHILFNQSSPSGPDPMTPAEGYPASAGSSL